MRHIGTLATERDARTFADWLLTRGVRCEVEPEPPAWSIWIVDEDHVPAGREALAIFAADPTAPVYQDARRQAAAIREAHIAKARASPVRTMRDIEVEGQTGLQPITIILMLVSITVTLLSEFGDRVEPFRAAFSMVHFIEQGGKLWFDPTFSEIRHGQVWRLFTPMFLHFTLLHLLFNMWGLYDVGSFLEARRGATRYLLLVLVTSLAGNVLQGLWVGPAFGGMSGVLYGLLGYAWIKSRYAPHLGIFVPPNAVMYFMTFLVLGFTGALGPIANGAHVGGLLAGMVWAYLPIALEKLRRHG